MNTTLHTGIPVRPDPVIYGSQAAKLTSRNAAELSVRPIRRANSFTSGVARFKRPNGSWKYTLKDRINSSRVHLFCWVGIYFYWCLAGLYCLARLQLGHWVSTRIVALFAQYNITDSYRLGQIEF